MGETNSPSVAHVGYDISPLKRAKLKILTISPLKRDFSTTGSAGLKRRNNGRNCVYPALPKSPKTTVKLSEKCGHHRRFNVGQVNFSFI
jgi:hypothetical protein